MDVSRVHGSIHSKKGLAHRGHHHLRASAAMHGVLAPQPGEGAEPGSADAPALQPAEASASLRYKQTERMGLVIQTQEGDTVRLRFRTSERLKAEISGGAEGDAPEISLAARTNSKISMSVKGDLSADELTAIHDTFNQAVALADEFFAGGLSSAFAGAEALNIDADQLARVSFKASFKQHLTYTSKGYAPSLPPEGPVVGDEPVGEEPVGGVPVGDEPVGEVPVGDEPVGEVPVGEEPVGEVPVGEEPVGEVPPGPEAPVEGLLSEAGGEPNDAPFELSPLEEGSYPDSVLPEVGAGDETEPAPTEPVPSEPAQTDPIQIIGDFLSRLAEAFGTSPNDGGSLDISLKIRIFQSALITLSEAQPPEEPTLPELVPETIEKVAELQQPPVDQMA